MPSLRTRPRMHTGIYSISMSIDGSESGLIGIPRLGAIRF